MSDNQAHLIFTRNNHPTTAVTTAKALCVATTSYSDANFLSPQTIEYQLCQQKQHQQPGWWWWWDSGTRVSKGPKLIFHPPSVDYRAIFRHFRHIFSSLKMPQILLITQVRFINEFVISVHCTSWPPCNFQCRVWSAYFDWELAGPIFPGRSVQLNMPRTADLLIIPHWKVSLSLWRSMDSCPQAA